MNLSDNQRKKYILAAGLVLFSVCLLGGWGFRNRPARETAAIEETPTPAPTVPTATVRPAPTGDAVRSSGATVDTVVYYADNYGYLVPVTRAVPEEEGIAKATLALMVQGPYNDMEAARLGLRTILPEGTEIDLDIAGGVARVDLGAQVLKMADAAAERNLVDAVVQTLTEFPTVEGVEFLIGGRARQTLTHGTGVEGVLTRTDINLESAPEGLLPEAAETVKLYFPGESSSLLVPVTRMVYGAGDIHTAVLEFAKGPNGQSPLDAALPEGCGLIDVTVKDGLATINFTKEFMRIAEESDGGRAALRALVLTCTQFTGVEKVEIAVEGEPYDPGANTLAVPTFVNEAAALYEEAIRTQAAMVLELD